MSDDLQHVIDQYVEALSEGIQERVDTLAAFYAPPHGRKALTKQWTSEEAYQNWMKHRFSEAGMTAVKSMSPEDVASLDSWLAEETRRRESAGLA